MATAPATSRARCSTGTGALLKEGGTAGGAVQTFEASGGRVLRVMFPMVSEPWEYEQARSLFEEQVEWSRNSHRKLPTKIEFGAMLEVPSLAEMLDQLLPRVDFISIGALTHGARSLHVSLEVT